MLKEKANVALHIIASPSRARHTTPQARLGTLPHWETNMNDRLELAEMEYAGEVTQFGHYLSARQVKRLRNEFRGRGRCITCRAWEEYEGPTLVGRDRKLPVIGYVGQCHRHAPVIVENIEDVSLVNGWWPETRYDKWCLDFEEKLS